MTTTRTLALGFAFALAAAVAACGGAGGAPYDPAQEPTATLVARLQFPTVMALQEKVIARSCTPNGGVCHNMKEYPDMHTPGNFVSAVAKPCNEDKASVPLQYFDGCEPKADEIEIAAIGYRSRIGSISGDLVQGDVGDVYREVTLENPLPADVSMTAARFLHDGATIAAVPANVSGAAGATTVRLDQLYSLDYQTVLALNDVVGGDPNQNGVFGYSDAWHEITPGHPEKSYLLGRITGTVAGSRMPLANQALSEPEYVAFFCFVETASAHPQPEDAIDYDACRFAKNPVDYTIP